MPDTFLKVYSKLMTTRPLSSCTSTARCRFRYEPLPSDLQQIALAVRATQFFDDSEADIAVELIEERLSKGPASGYDFVFAEQNADWLGYTCFGEIPCTSQSYDLYWIVVAPEYQRLGIGRLLMQETERLVCARGGRQIYIDTSGRQQYASTRAFYERCEYTVAAEFPDFYAVGDSKLVYTRRLAGAN